MEKIQKLKFNYVNLVLKLAGELISNQHLTLTLSAMVGHPQTHECEEEIYYGLMPHKPSLCFLQRFLISWT